MNQNLAEATKCNLEFDIGNSEMNSIRALEYVSTHYSQNEELVQHLQFYVWDVTFLKIMWRI